MLQQRLTLWAALSSIFFWSSSVFPMEITVERSPGGAVVKIDGRLFTEYLTSSPGKPSVPILWPIIGPTGAAMTRAYPMENRSGEKQDHPHHRSLWFAHGDINGVNFWAETQKGKVGTVAHLEFTRLESGKPAIIAARNAWLDPDGKKICEDHRTLRFDADETARWIDFDIEFKATEEPVTFGDTKEGTFGVRVAESIKVDARLGGKIINSHGQENEAAWAKRADWVDYFGPVKGRIAGIAIINHPSSLRYPTFWHVRTYGLFMANPFGFQTFTGDKNQNGSYTLPAGETLKFQYRVLLHVGDHREGRIAERAAAYFKEAK